MSTKPDFRPRVLMACAVVGVVALALAALLPRDVVPPTTSALPGSDAVRPSGETSTKGVAAKAASTAAVAPSRRASPGADQAPQADSTARRAAAETLPFERPLASQGLMDAQRTDALMASAGFHRALDAMELEMAKDPLALEQRDAYAAKLTDQLANDPDKPEVGRLVCGLELCVGTVLAPSTDAFRRWMSIQFTQGRKHNDIQTLSVGPSIITGDRVEQRFVFSTSRSVAGFLVRDP